MGRCQECAAIWSFLMDNECIASGGPRSGLGHALCTVGRQQIQWLTQGSIQGRAAAQSLGNGSCGSALRCQLSALPCEIRFFLQRRIGRRISPPQKIFLQLELFARNSFFCIANSAETFFACRNYFCIRKLLHANFFSAAENCQC